jgi:hypothetical protein
MQQAVEDHGGEHLVARKDLRRVAHVFVRCAQHRAAFVARRGESEEEIRLDAVRRTEADFVDDQQAAIEVAHFVHRELRRLFRIHGLPDAIRSHNSAPFASNDMHGLNRLNAWSLQLGMVNQRIMPASPQESGAHERMHRALKANVAKPAAAIAKLQQRLFNTFVQTYNEVRPHEALNEETPASRWRPSARPLPTRIIPPTYPGHFEIRRVSTAGTFRLHNGQQFLTQALNGETIGLEEVQYGVWNVIYYETLLGRFDERTRTITGAPSLKKDC